MENRERRHITKHQDQENASKKSNVSVLAKRLGLSDRGALGELHCNVQPQPIINTGKVAAIVTEYEKISGTNLGFVRRKYHRGQSRVDTGLATKPIVQPSSRPPLSRQEITGGLAVRATARGGSKHAQNKKNETKHTVNVQEKKAAQGKKITKPLKKAKRNLKPLATELMVEMAHNFKIRTNKKKRITILSPIEETLTEYFDEDIDESDYCIPPYLLSFNKDIYKLTYF